MDAFLGGVIRLTLLGVGAMNSPRYAPAGLLVERGRTRVVLDGGPGAAPHGRADAWLVTDARAELIREIRALARPRGLEPAVAGFEKDGLYVAPRPVVHTSHPTYGYLVRADGLSVAWAPEFLVFPSWADGVDLLFADAAGWNRPIRFAGGVGGHTAALDVCRDAKERGVKKLVLAHIGRPTIRAIDRGEAPPFGDFGEDGEVFVLRAARRARAPLVEIAGLPRRRPPLHTSSAPRTKGAG